MILLCGIPSEPPLRKVAEACAEADYPFVLVDQRRFERYEMHVAVGDGGIRGELVVDGKAIELQRFHGVYTRVTDWNVLPALQGLAKNDPLVCRCAELHQRLLTWYENAPIRVVNRSAAMASNGSKPFQAQRIVAAGFAIPETLVSNEPDEVRSFATKHGRVIFKSCSGERSIVTEFGPQHESALSRLARCPTQFQRYVSGTDVRVHVVGNEVFATRIQSGAVDYRYDRNNGGAGLQQTELDASTRERCVALARALELPLTGIDLRLGEDGATYCFEANPSPAFSYYEDGTGQPIAAAIANYLAGN